MNPVLYDNTETKFDTKGIGTLIDAITCEVTEERNGAYELYMLYPVTGILYQQIKNDCLILAKPNETDRDQPFRIYSISKPIEGIVTVLAEHISYQTVEIPVFPFVASNAPEAAAKLVQNSVTPNPFALSTDKTTSGTFRITEPVTFRSRLCGVEGSMLDVYGGGDYEFDRWNIFLRARRGRDTEVVVEYGKNLTDLRQEESIDSLIHGVAPYWADTDGNLVTLPERVIILQNNYSYSRVVPLNLSSNFDTAPTAAQLRQEANHYLDTTNLTDPKVSLTVSFVPIWQTENYIENPLYKQMAGLERLALCDTVKVRFIKLGVDVSARIVRTVFDTLMERYISMDIGEPRSTLIDRAARQQIQLEKTPTTSYLEQAIQRATEAITGASGGYVALDPPKNPQRILIMDKPTKEQALRLWQWNLNGLGYSKNGINGPYGTAMTMLGEIVADYITTGTLNAALAKVINIDATNINTGTLNADLIKAGTLNAELTNVINLNASNIIAGMLSANRVRAGILSSYDDSTYFDLDNNMIVSTSKSRVSEKSIYSRLSQSGFVLRVGTMPTNTERDGGIFITTDERAMCITYSLLLQSNGVNYGWFYLSDDNKSSLRTHKISDGTYTCDVKWEWDGTKGKFYLTGTQ